MATTLTSSYKFIKRSNAVSCDNGWNYYILLYAKTSPSTSTGKHTVTVKQILACTNDSTFHNWDTTGYVKVNGTSAFSWSNARVPLESWGSSSSITAGGVTYKRHTVLKEGSVVVNTAFAEKTITLSSYWKMEDSNSAGWFPYKTPAEISADVTLSAIATASVPTVSVSSVVMGNSVTITTKRSSTALTHTLTYKVGDTTGTIATGVGDSKAWTVPWFSNIKSSTCTITCKTYSGSTLLGTKTVTLTITAPAKSTVSASNAKMGNATAISITRASTKLTHKLYYTFGGTKTLMASGVGASYSWTVPDLAAKCNNALSGSCTITCETYNGTALLGSATKSITLSVQDPTVPTVSAGSVNMGSAVTIKTARKSSNFTHTLSYSFSGATGTIGSGVTTSKSWTPEYALAKKIPSATFGTCTITCTTYNGTKKVGDAQTVTLRLNVPNNSTTKPTFTYKLAPNKNIVTSGFIDRVSLAGKYVQTKSKVVATFTASSTYSTIAKYTLTVDDIPSESAAASVTSGYLAKSGGRTVKLRVTDARGYYTEKTATITVLGYTNPSVVPISGMTSIVCERKAVASSTDLTYDHLYIKAARKYTKLSGENVLTGTGFTQGNLCTLRYRWKSVDDEWTDNWRYLIYSAQLETDVYDGVAYKEHSNATSSVRTPIQLNKTQSYDVQLQVYDVNNVGFSQYFTIPTEYVTFHLGEGGKKAAFGKYAEEENTLEFADDWNLHAMGDAKIDGNLTLGKALPVAQGGTGASTPSAALANLGAADLGSNSFTGSQIIDDASSLGLGFVIERPVSGVGHRAAMMVNGTYGSTRITHQTKNSSGEYVVDNAMNLLPEKTEFSKPITLESGGTGETTRRESVTISGLPAGSGYTCYYYPYLGMAFLRLYLTGAAIAASATLTVGTVASKVPNSYHALSVMALQHLTSEIRARISSSGAIQLISGEAIVSSDDIYITGFWFV